jgi:hypothetical protein
MKVYHSVTLDRCPWCHQPMLTGHESDAAQYYAWMAPSEQQARAAELIHEANQKWIADQNEAMRKRSNRRFNAQAALISVATAVVVAAVVYQLYWN